MYSKPKRIPTILAFVLLVLGIGVSVFLVSQGTFVVTQAAPDYRPHDVTVSNITDSSFVVSYWTQDPTTSAVTLQNGSAFLPENKGDTTTHVVEVDSLEPGTSYPFSIVSNSETYQDASYVGVTGAVLSITPPPVPSMSGKVLMPNGGGAEGAIVYLTVEDSQIMSTVVGSDGEYMFVFPQGIRTRDLRGFYVLEDGDFLHLVSRMGDLSSEVNAPYGDILPPITLSYDFEFESTESAQISQLNSELFTTNPIVYSGGLVVLSPVEGDLLVDARPTILGTGVAGTRVAIQIDPGKVMGNAEVDSGGQWSYRPDASLSSGEKTLTAQGVGANGVSQSKIVNFQIFPSGSQVSETATPSATPTLSLTPTAPSVPTPTATQVPTVTPPVGGVSPSPEVTVTAAPTMTPTPTFAPTPTITPFLKVTPTPPGSIGGVILTFASLAFIVTGATLLFLLG